MKKILLFISIGITAIGFSQNSILITNRSTSLTMVPSETVYLTTSAGGNTNKLFDIKNTSATTHTYILKRYDTQLNTGALAYFCFAGTCFDNLTTVSGNLVLAAGQSASDFTTASTMLTTDLDEGPSVGQSHIKYSFRNINVIADSIQINLKYNYVDPAASIKEYASPFKSFDISPNPANDNVNILLTHKGNELGEISLINALGQTVYTKQTSFVEGKNKVNINIENLSNGIYFARVKSGEFVSTKKIIIQ